MKTIQRTNGHAEIEVTEGHGYHIDVYRGKELVEDYDAGDAQFDSKVFGSGELSRETLEQYADRTANEMLDEHEVE